MRRQDFGGVGGIKGRAQKAAQKLTRWLGQGHDLWSLYRSGQDRMRASPITMTAREGSCCIYWPRPIRRRSNIVTSVALLPFSLLAIMRAAGFRRRSISLASKIG